MPRRAPSEDDQATPLLQARIRGLFRHLPKGLAGDEEAVHQMRVAGRRLRVALPILSSQPGGKRTARALQLLRRMTRIAGLSRDRDVTVSLLTKRLEAGDRPKAETRTLLRRLKASRTGSRARMAEALLDLEIAKMRRDLRSIVRRREEGLFPVLARLQRARDERGAQILDTLRLVGARFDPESLHRLRIRVRKLRYLAEIIDHLLGRQSKAPELLRELQDALGHIRDAHVAALWLGGQAARSAARSESAIAAEARALETEFDTLARNHHRDLLERDPVAIVQRGLVAMGGARTAA